MTLTLIQAQERYIQRVNSCHPGHKRRVARAAWEQLTNWAYTHGYSEGWKVICQDAKDMARLQRDCED